MKTSALLALACIAALAQAAPAQASAQHDAHAHDRHDAHATAAGSVHGAHASHGVRTSRDAPADHGGQASHDAHAGHGAATAHDARAGHHMPAQHDSHAGHGTSAPHQGHGPGAQDPCTPEHAAMGHCTPRGATPLEPREPIPEPTDADRAAAFPDLHVGHGHGSALHWRVLFNRFEAWDAEPGTGQAWSGSLWLGGDVNRLRVKSSGERNGGHTRSASTEALYSRSVTPWWDLVAGARHEFQPDSRTWGAIGLQGLAPYMFEVSAMAYVGSGGQVQLKVEAEYEVLLTNRLILQPMVEATASLEDEPEAGIGSGLGKLEAGLRLRYEVTRRFAPYIGVTHERALGNTADIARASGGHLRDTRVVAGVRFWF